MTREFDDSQTYKIIGAAMAVHRALGCGFLEAVSREAFTIELQERGIPFVREARLAVRYRLPRISPETPDVRRRGAAAQRERRTV